MASDDSHPPPSHSSDGFLESSMMIGQVNPSAVRVQTSEMLHETLDCSTDELSVARIFDDEFGRIIYKIWTQEFWVEIKEGKEQWSSLGPFNDKFETFQSYKNAVLGSHGSKAISESLLLFEAELENSNFNHPDVSFGSQTRVQGCPVLDELSRRTPKESINQDKTTNAASLVSDQSSGHAPQADLHGQTEETGDPFPTPRKKYIGVRKRKSGKWGVEMRDPEHKGKKKWLGTFDTPEEAAREYDRANTMHGTKASLNFPPVAAAGNVEKLTPCRKRLPLRESDKKEVVGEVRPTKKEEERHSGMNTVESSPITPSTTSVAAAQENSPRRKDGFVTERGKKKSPPKPPPSISSHELSVLNEECGSAIEADDVGANLDQDLNHQKEKKNLQSKSSGTPSPSLVESVISQQSCETGKGNEQQDRSRVVGSNSLSNSSPSRILACPQQPQCPSESPTVQNDGSVPKDRRNAEANDVDDAARSFPKLPQNARVPASHSRNVENMSNISTQNPTSAAGENCQQAQFIPGQTNHASSSSDLNSLKSSTHHPQDGSNMPSLRPTTVSASNSHTFNPPETGNSDYYDVEIKDELTAEAENEFTKKALVGYFVEGAPSEQEVRDVLASSACKPSRNFQILAVNEVLYVFIFSSWDESQDILQHGHWDVNGKPLALRRWSPDLSFQKDELSKIPVWIHFPDFPLQFRRQAVFGDIAGKVGIVLHTEKGTIAGDKLTFDKVCIEAVAGQELRNSIKIKYKDKIQEQIVQYPWMPKSCSQCATFSHHDNSCPLKS